MPYKKPYAPRTLKRLYTQLGLPEETVGLLHDYLDAASNLYYVIPLSNVYRQFSINHPELHVTEEDLKKFTAIVAREEQFYRILSTAEFYDDLEPRDCYELLINEELLESPTPGGEGDEMFYELFESQDNFSYRVFDEKEFLRYCDEDYFEETPEVEQVRRFLRDEFNLSRFACDEVVSKFYEFSRLLWDDESVFIQPIFSYLMMEMPGEIDDEKFEEFMEMSLEMVSAWPSPLLGGHSIKEFEKRERENALIKEPIPFGPEVSELISCSAIDTPHYLADLVLAYGLPKDVRDNFIDQAERLMPEKERAACTGLFHLLRDERFVSMYRLTPDDWEHHGMLYGIPYPDEMAEELLEGASAVDPEEDPVAHLASRAPKRGKLIN